MPIMQPCASSQDRMQFGFSALTCAASVGQEVDAEPRKLAAHCERWHVIQLVTSHRGDLKNNNKKTHSTHRRSITRPEMTDNDCFYANWLLGKLHEGQWTRIERSQQDGSDSGVSSKLFPTTISGAGLVGGFIVKKLTQNATAKRHTARGAALNLSLEVCHTTKGYSDSA